MCTTVTSICMVINVFVHFRTANVWSPETAELSYPYEDRFWIIVDILSISNHSLNFYLYILSGTEFRNQFLIMMKCKPKKLPVVKTKSDISTISTQLQIKERSGSDF